MANKTATLKNQAGDNIYPNIVGDNRNAAIKDSTTIKHTLAENKISLDLDEAIKGKIDAALQKPSGLTKTELVGVGANGQENVEIGDNLTLANGKLAAAGGSVSPTLNLIDLNNDEVRTIITEEEYNNLKNGLYNSVNYYTETPDEAYLQSKLVSAYDDSDGSLNCVFSSIKLTGTSETDLSSTNIIYQLNIGQKDTSGNYPITIEKAMEIPFGSSSGGGGSSENDNLNIIYLDMDANRIYGDYNNNKENIAIGTNRILFGTSKVNITDNVVTSVIMEGIWDVFGQLCSYQLELNFNTKEFEVDYTKLKPISISHYSHFITMTDSTSNVALYLTIQNASDIQFTANTLASYLAGKKVLANGNLHGVVPTYIAGEGGVIKIYYMTPGDSNINPTPDEYQDLSSFTITDLVSPVE